MKEKLTYFIESIFEEKTEQDSESTTRIGLSLRAQRPKLSTAFGVPSHLTHSVPPIRPSAPF